MDAQTKDVKKPKKIEVNLGFISSQKKETEHKVGLLKKPNLHHAI